jgi:hypothetical protein
LHKKTEGESVRGREGERGMERGGGGRDRDIEREREREKDETRGRTVVTTIL